MPDELDEAFADYIKEHGPSTPPAAAAKDAWLIVAVMATGIAMLAPLSMMLFWRRVSSEPSPAEEQAPAETDAPAGVPESSEQPKEKYRSAQELRDNLDGAALIVEAGKKKEQANNLLKLDLPEPALQIYLSGIWLLKVGRPPYPQVLSGQQPPSDEKAAALLGSGMGAEPAPEKREPGIVAAAKRGAVRAWRARFSPPPPPPDALEGDEAEAMRRTLHLNVAAVALKIHDYYLAREACKYVLIKQPANAKALYRLAQAYDGTRDPRAALKALTTLIKAEPKNREARAMWEKLKTQTAEEKSFFKGIASKAKDGFGATDAPPPPVHAEVEDELTQRIRALLDHEEMEKEKAAAAAAAKAEKEAVGMPPTVQEKMKEKAEARAAADAAAAANAAQPPVVAE